MQGKAGEGKDESKDSQGMERMEAGIGMGKRGSRQGLAGEDMHRGKGRQNSRTR